jgi:hypothetical protein
VGRGTNYKRSIKLYSPANTDIYITARAAGEEDLDERILCIANKYGYVIGTSHVEAKKGVLTYRFSYNKDHFYGEDLYIRSLDSGIDIYDIRLVSRVENTNTLETSLNFSDSKFDDYPSTYCDDFKIDDVFTISASTASTELQTDNKYVYLVYKDRMYDGKQYTRRLELVGQGSDEYRNIKINVPGSVNIKVIATHSGKSSDLRELDLFDKYGFIIDKNFEDFKSDVEQQNEVTPIYFNYEGGENTLYLRTKEYGAYIYEIVVSSSAYGYVGPSNTSTTNNVSSDSMIVYNDETTSSSAFEIKHTQNEREDDIEDSDAYVDKETEVEIETDIDIDKETDVSTKLSYVMDEYT